MIQKREKKIRIKQKLKLINIMKAVKTGLVPLGPPPHPAVHLAAGERPLNYEWPAANGLH